MKPLLIFLCIITTNCYSQDTALVNCTDRYEALILQSDTLTPPCDSMVLLDGMTYTNYVYNSSKLKFLEKSVPEYKTLADSLDILYKQQTDDLDSVQTTMATKIELEQRKKETAVVTVMKLDKENFKLKGERKILKKRGRTKTIIIIGLVALDVLIFSLK